MNEFDIKAPAWDMNPVHLERSKIIAKLLTEATSGGQKLKALDFGAGSGILSLLLHDHFKEITLMDSSEGMIKVINDKIATTGITNLKPLCLDLEKETFNGKFDLIFSQMVFHHVEDIDGILEKFRALLNPGGFIAIADLYPEDGSFHGEGFTGHLGFDPEQLSAKFSAHGFTSVSYSECFVMKKVLPNGESKDFPIFLMKGHKDLN